MTRRLSWKPKAKRLRHRPMMTRPMAKAVARTTANYEPIPADTRLFVWNRDGGACRNCGSTHELHFDHIIPRTRGGSNRAENIELLCRTCNLKKGTRLSAPPTLSMEA